MLVRSVALLILTLFHIGFKLCAKVCRCFSFRFSLCYAV